MNESEMTSNILGCIIGEEDTGVPLFSCFFDPALKKNPSVMSQKIKSKEMKRVHVFGVHTVFTALVAQETPEAEVKELLRAFKAKVDKIYPDELKRGSGKLADMLILQNIVKEVFIEDKK